MQISCFQYGGVFRSKVIDRVVFVIGVFVACVVYVLRLGLRSAVHVVVAVNRLLVLSLRFLFSDITLRSCCGAGLCLLSVCVFA